MINNLRIKFIKIAAASVIGVLLFIYGGFFVLNTIQLENELDSLTSMLSENEGRFPDEKNKQMGPDKPVDKRINPKEIMDKETRFSTRFFVVAMNSDNTDAEVDVDFIASVDREQALEYANEVLASGKDTGWYSSFRYRISRSEALTRIVFVDGSRNQSMMASAMLSAAIILVCCGLVVILLIVFLSKKAVKPVAESYAKQKQFITDANHELKTPLTLILANLDIAEMELGKNEWLEDIRFEGEKMAGLVNKLVALSRMDEENSQLSRENFNLSEACLDVVSEFQVGAESQGKDFKSYIPNDVMLKGDESALRQLCSILLDNALKYCDSEGSIEFRLEAGHHPTILVTNTFKEVDNTELDRLFDRFYRSDKARTSGSGYGIGLSIAKAIVEQHGGKISATRAGDGLIGFKVIL